MAATFRTTVAILAMLAVVGSGSSESKELGDGRKDLFLTEQEAHSFVGNHRAKRSFWNLFANLEEECAHEGCSFEEVTEWDKSTSEAQEYLMTLACRLWPCSSGYRCQGVRHGTTGSGSHWRVCNAVCFGSTSCPHGGHCSRPNYCSGCERGYESPRCADIDECADRRICDDHATCTNTDGSYSCQCAAGYVGDGHTCTDVDECANRRTCDNHATCTNTDGSYTCQCAPGYLGDGHTCTEITTTVQSTTSTTTTDKQTSSAQTSAKTTTTVAEPTTTTAKPLPTTVGKAPSTEKPVVVQDTESVSKSSPEMTTEDPEVLLNAAELSDVCGDDGKQPCGKQPMPLVEKTMLILGTVAFAFACGIAFIIYHLKIKNGVLFPSWLIGRRQEPPPPPYSEGHMAVVTVATKVELPPDIKISTKDKDDLPPGYEVSSELPPGKEILDDPVKILPPQETDVTDIEFILKSNALEEKAPMN